MAGPDRLTATGRRSTVWWTAVRWSAPAMLVFAIYHTVRDVGTEFLGLSGEFWDAGHRSHAWCGATCGLVTLPLELFNIAVCVLLLARRRAGRLALVNLATLVLWLLAWFLP